MATLNLIKIGNSVGVILPKETLARLHVDAGDKLHQGEIPGGITLSPYDPEFEKQMEAAERIMKRRRNVLRKLGQ